MDRVVTRTRKRKRLSRFSSTDDITQREWIHIIRNFMPETIRKACALMKMPRWDPWPHKPSGIMEMPDSGPPKGTEFRIGKLVVLGGRHLAGKPSVPRYYHDDEFFPVLEFASHRLARGWRQDCRSNDEIARSFAIDMEVVEAGKNSPKFAVPVLIHAFRRIQVEQRTIDEYHCQFRKADGFTQNPQNERSYLEAAIRSFLREFPVTR